MVVTVTSRKGKTVQGTGGKKEIIIHEENTIHETAKTILNSDIREKKRSSRAFATSYSLFSSI